MRVCDISMGHFEDQLSLLLHNAEKDRPCLGNAAPDAQWLEDFRINLYALSLVRGIGEVTLKTLLQAYNTPAAVWEKSADELSRLFSSIGLKSPQEAISQILTKRKLLVERATRELEKFAKDDIRLLTMHDKEYPPQLRSTKDAPKWLFVQGDVSCLSMPNLVAVVGTRAATPAGLDRARTLTKWLAEKNIGIVSGLAEGIDETAHQAALDFGVPTIGVLGTGILLYFPASTSALRRRIINESGAVVTEYWPNANFSRAQFVRRNRIQAALSYAVVPTEGRESSGTAHTYRFAKEYGKVTFGVKKGKAVGADGIHNLLRADNRPVFDLESNDDMAALAELLRPVSGLSNIHNQRHRRTATVLAYLRTFLQKNKLSEDELDDLLREVRQIWRDNVGG
jgi:DNA protecting protein DprA